MGEDPKKGIQDQKVSDNNESSKLSHSKDISAVESSHKEEYPKDSSINDDKSVSDGKSTEKHPSRRFRDFLMSSDIDDPESDSSNAKSSENFKGKSKEKKINNKGGNKKDSSESDEFHLSDEFMKFKLFRNLRSNKEKVIQITGGIFGVLFIIAGIVYMLGSSVRVADNVVYGERAVISAFSILIGILIIAGFFGRQILAKTFLKEVHKELEEVEEGSSTNKSSNEKEKSAKVNKKQKDNIEEKDKK
jgi:hypothetical protein